MDDTEYATQIRQRGTQGLGLFDSALQKRDEAIEVADNNVKTSVGGDMFVGRITQRIVQDFAVGESFSVDVVGAYLDTAGVPKDADTRRRIAGTIINRGKNKLWRHTGYRSSTDPRRNARPVAVWERI